MHIIKIYSHYGINEFIICCGYKSYIIKEYFANYSLHSSDITFDFSTNTTTIHKQNSEPWKVTLVDTGANTMTGGRIARIKDYLKDTFCLTYGDGVSNVDINQLINFHKSHGKLATLTSVQPPGRWGNLTIDGDNIIDFQEKAEGDGGWINGGYFVLNKKVIDFIDGDQCIWEQSPLKKLSKLGELKTFKHTSFWHPMDTLRDKENLERMWNSKTALWKVWGDDK